MVSSTCKASKLSGKRKSYLCLQDLLYMQGGLPPALKGSNRICSICEYDREKVVQASDWDAEQRAIGKIKEERMIPDNQLTILGSEVARYAMESSGIYSFRVL